jgi:HK97 gp10 family phage protein
MPSAAVRGEISVALERFRFNEAGMRELLQGPVSRDLVRRAIRVEAQAKRNASQPPPSVAGSGPSVRTGRLRGSITWRLGVDAISPYADIGSAVFYAPFVELGTSRMQARPYLRPALEAARVTI